MSVCVPKNIVCGTYVPDFVPGNQPCILQSFNETRARLLGGGAFFRSVDVGAQNNIIRVSCIWQQLVGVIWVNTSSPTLCGRIELTITNGIITETYHADQSGTTVLPVGMEPGVFSWNINAIPSMETQLLSSGLVS